jgi:putative redox protein
VIAAWAVRYLPVQVGDLPDISHGEGVLAEETGAGLFQLSMRSEKQRFLADEPESVVGLARRLSPYELISAGLPACTVMTMRMYARQKGIPLETGATPTRADACHNLTAHELLP